VEAESEAQEERS